MKKTVGAVALSSRRWKAYLATVPGIERIKKRLRHCCPLPHTDRLILREYRREDFDVFAAHLADPVSSAHLGLADRHAAWRIFCSQAGLWLIHGAGWWAVEENVYA